MCHVQLSTIFNLIKNDLFLKEFTGPKHTKGQSSNKIDAGIEPENSLELFENSVQSGKKRYSIDSEGNVHQFTYTNTGDNTWHWAGRSGTDQLSVQRLLKGDIPNDILKQFNIKPKGEFK